MRLGRNFTNLLEFEYLDKDDRAAFIADKLTVSDMDATVQIKVKRDIARQVQVARETGLDHIELDGGIPNPYLSMSKDEIKKGRAAAEKADVTMSMHLPYTFTATATCGFQEEDRVVACEYMKRYIDVCAALGCKFTVMHPGAIPYYQAVGRYLDISNEMLLRSLTELGTYSDKKGVRLHMENNTFWDGRLFKADAELLSIFKKVRARGIDLRFCFDLAHEFTGFEKSEQIPDNPELRYREIPNELYMGIQIGDFIPEGRQFHPLLHRAPGKLKRENIVNMFRIFQEVGVEYVVIESAVRSREDLIAAFDLQTAEAKWARECFNEAHASAKPKGKPAARRKAVSKGR